MNIICQLTEMGQIEILDADLLAAVEGGAAQSPYLISKNLGCTNEADCTSTGNGGICSNQGTC